MSSEEQRKIDVDMNVTKHVKEKTSSKKGRKIDSKINVKGQRTESSKFTNNVEDNKESTNGNEKEDGWTKVVSRKRKNVNKKAVKGCNDNERCSANDASSEDSFVTFKDPKKKKVSKSKTKKIISPTSKCPVCMRFFKRVLQHLNKDKRCKSQCTNAQRELLNNVSKQRRLEKKREVKKKSYENDPESARTRKRNWMRKHREKQNPLVLKEYQRNLKSRSRIADTPNERLKNFLVSTIHNAVFICISCHQRCFRSNVIEYTEKVMASILTEYPDILKECIINDNIAFKFQTQFPHEKWTEEFKDEIGCKEHKYICNTCIKYLRRNKMPPLCAANGLKLNEAEKMLKSEDLLLTELEGALIARSIIFMKIFLLPKSRWTALKDRAINVPIPESSVLNTINMLPRTPKEAGLVAVSLKRKKEFKNSHKSQMINTERMFRVLKNLKDNNHPYYKFYDDHNAYEQRCFQTDPDGYELTHGDIDDEVLEELERMETTDDVDIHDEVSDCNENQTSQGTPVNIEDENDDIINDPVRKFHFDYDKSLCLADKYPEISVAPGEGQRPSNLLSEKDWDIKAFSYLHNYDGSNSLHQKRKVRMEIST